jgi:hypothetical protein
MVFGTNVHTISASKDVFKKKHIGFSGEGKDLLSHH